MSKTKQISKGKDPEYSSFLKKWKESTKLQPSGAVNQEMITFFNGIEVYLPKEQLIFIYELNDFRPVYVSPNIEKVLGYTQEEYLKLGYKSHMPPDGYSSFKYLEELLVCGKELEQIVIEKNFKQKRFESFIFGRQLQSKTGAIQHFLLCNNMTIDENNNGPESSIITFHQIDHFLNSTPTLWFYFKSINDENEVCLFSKYDDKRHVASRLISDREREVFSYIAKGSSSKEVAALLNLSSETIDKHRKNVMHRLGLKNTTSVIQILKICGEL